MIDFDEVALKLAKAEADNEVLRKALDLAVCALNRINCEMRKETMPDFAVFVDALKALEQIKEITKGSKDEYKK